MEPVHEPARETPVIAECDVCVAGGGVTGVFAAVAAARAGAEVVLVERYGFLGGMATAGLVSVWHSLYDTSGEIEIIRGLTREVIERLRARGAVIDRDTSSGTGYSFDTEQMKLELDDLAIGADVRVLFHAWLAGAVVDDGRVEAAIVETKSGRAAVRAKAFVDATGDGDLAAAAGFPFEKSPHLQPPTTCFHLAGLPDGIRLQKTLFAPEYRDRLPAGFLWSTVIPGRPGTIMVAGTRAFGADCADAWSFSHAETEGRRQVRAMLDILHATPGCENATVTCIAPQIGVRETRRFTGLHVLTEEEVLTGVRFPDAIANGSYRVDIHEAEGEGLTFRYLDGRQVFIGADGRREESRWCDECDAYPTFYQIPYRSLVPVGSENLLVAGRCISTDTNAFGATRVMVNCNQTGHTAGLAAAKVAATGQPAPDINTDDLRRALESQGAAII